MFVDVILIATLMVLGYLVASIFYPMLAGGACYTPTPRRAVAKALHMADLKKGEVFYDLGCGTGGALLEASRSCDHVIGVEIEPLRWLVARFRARKAKVILGDLFKQDISDADVVFLYQYQGSINDRIAAKIKAETQAGTRVVSYEHEIGNMTLVRNQDQIFVYET